MSVLHEMLSIYQVEFDVRSARLRQSVTVSHAPCKAGGSRGGLCTERLSHPARHIMHRSLQLRRSGKCPQRRSLRHIRHSHTPLLGDCSSGLAHANSGDRDYC